MDTRIIVIVDDNYGDFILIREYLELEAPGQYSCVYHPSFDAFLCGLADSPLHPDAVLIDCEDNGRRGLQDLRSAVDHLPTTPVIGMSEELLSESARAALDSGATHFIAKNDLTPARLVQTLAYTCANEQRLRGLFERAHFDPLTGLANRGLLSDRIGHALERCQRSGEHAALLMIDLDDFKQINDGYGHDIGDSFLREIATALRSSVRDSDTVARLGGDEFAILLEGLRHAEGALQIAAKLQAISQQIVRVGGIELRPALSIGVSLFTPESSRFTSEWLCKAADIALYRAKSLGKNQYCVFTDELDQQMVDNLELDHAIRCGLERSELLLHYQPIVNSDMHRMIAVEALLRWQHPARGMMAPATFLPAVEKLGFMQQVGRFVLKEALRQFADWNTTNGVIPTLHVNVSAAQLSAHGFAAYVADELTSAGISAGRVCLELTESLLFDQSATLRTELGALRELGVRFAIDDFGTGYGSYNYLKSFPIDSIKIDKRFVDALDRDATDRAIVRSILGLAGELGLEVTVEGVETVEQLRQLRHLGATNLQGFLFHRPLPALEIARLAASGQQRPAIRAINAQAAG